MEFIDNFLADNNLRKPNLNCLIQDHRLYKTSLLQVGGKIEYDNDGIRFANKAEAFLKFDEFINKSIDENVDLAITPEYSCPWDLIVQTIKSQKFPSLGKLWVFGCQSIKPKEILEIISKTDDVHWIYEKDLIGENIDENKFFDPVCIFFKTNDLLGKEVKVAVLQFKTHGFGGNDFEWERDYSISGKRIFIIDNEIKSTKLIALICSDTLQELNFNTINNGYFVNEPLLIIHIQLNQKPQNANYKTYRNHIFSKGNVEYDKEIICLNWARNVKYDFEGVEKTFNKYGGSGFYLKTLKLDATDDTINLNHAKGLYYTYWLDKRTHIYFLSYDEYIFIINNTKPSQFNSDATQYKRTGPKVIKSLSWKDNSWTEEQKVDDGFSKFCDEIEKQHGELDCLKTGDYINNERIIDLSSGNITFKDGWHDITNLKSCKIEDSEISNRNIFTQEPDTLSQELRQERILKYSLLKHEILNDPEKVPSVFLNGELKYNFATYSIHNHLLNLQSINIDLKGTGIFLGYNVKGKAQSIKDKVQDLFSGSQQGKQVFVWFNNGKNIETLSDEEFKPEIGENTSKSRKSITKRRRI